MLILTRRIGESIRIGDDVCVTVLEVKGQQVRVGIAAPTSVRVHREEVFHRIEREQALSRRPGQPEAQTPPDATPKVSVRRTGRKVLSPTLG